MDKSLKSVIDRHPNKKEIIEGISEALGLSIDSVRRKIKDESILGKSGMINHLYLNHAIEVSPLGHKIDYLKLERMENERFEKTKRVF